MENAMYAFVLLVALMGFSTGFEEDSSSSEELERSLRSFGSKVYEGFGPKRRHVVGDDIHTRSYPEARPPSVETIQAIDTDLLYARMYRNELHKYIMDHPYGANREALVMIELCGRDADAKYKHSHWGDQELLANATTFVYDRVGGEEQFRKLYNEAFEMWKVTGKYGQHCVHSFARTVLH